MRYNLRAVTTQTRDLETALLFQAEDMNYLFSCPDIFQRIAAAQKVRFRNVQYFFLPALGPDYFSGFMGFYLSAREGVADLDSWQICLMGPKGLKDLMRSSTFAADYFTNVQIIEFPDNLDQPINLPQPQPDEDQMEVDESSQPLEEEQKTTTASRNIVSLTFIEETQRVAFKDENVTIYPIRAEGSNGSVMYSFAIVPAQGRGKFLPQVATKLGCKPKEHFRTLTTGQSVTLDDGTVVTSDQVSEKPVAANASLLVFLPDAQYIEQFVHSNVNFFQQLQRVEPERAYNLGLVYHACTQEVRQDQTYRQEFLVQFSDQVLHCFDNPDLNIEEYARPKAFHHTQLVKAICPQITPLNAIEFQENDLRIQKLKDFVQVINNERQSQSGTAAFKAMTAQSGLVFDLPKGTLDYTYVTTQTAQLQKTNSEQLESMIKLSDEQRSQSLDEQTRQFLAEKAETLYAPNPATSSLDEPQLLFLGTSSMKPTQHRGASAIYMFSKNAGLLMDVAEGTYGQLYDHFQTKAQVSQVLCKTRVILITHIHGDHAFGIYKILLERDRALQQIPESQRTPVYCVFPSIMMSSVEYFIDHNVSMPQHIKLINSSDCNPEPESWYSKLHDIDPSVPYECRQNNTTDVCPKVSRDEINDRIAQFAPTKAQVSEMYSVMSETLGFDKLVMCEVNHCMEAYCAVAVSSIHGNVLYSGDTLPCQNLKNYAQTARVLIHEATLQDGMEEDAAKKMHTTTGQALTIGIEGGVWRTILTHFSPRYQKVAEITPQMAQANALVAFDHTRVSWSQLEWAHKIRVLYEALLSNEDEKKAPTAEESKVAENNNSGGKKQKVKKQKKEKEQTQAVVSESAQQ